MNTIEIIRGLPPGEGRRLVWAKRLLAAAEEGGSVVEPLPSSGLTSLGPIAQEGLKTIPLQPGFIQALSTGGITWSLSRDTVFISELTAAVARLRDRVYAWMEREGLKHPPPGVVNLGDRTYDEVAAGKPIPIRVRGFTRAEGDPLRRLLVLKVKPKAGSLERVIIQSGVADYPAMRGLAAFLEEPGLEVIVELIPKAGVRPFMGMLRLIGPPTEDEARRELVHTALTNELMYLEHVVYEWLGRSGSDPANWAILPGAYESIRDHGMITITIIGFTRRLPYWPRIRAMVEGHTGLISRLMIQVGDLNPDPALAGLLSMLPGRMHPTVEDGLGRTYGPPRIAGGPLRQLGEAPPPPGGVRDLLRRERPPLGKTPADLRRELGLEPPLLHPAMLARAARIRHYMSHVAQASLSGQIGWAPRTPAEASMQFSNAVDIPPAIQNWQAGQLGRPLPFPQMGRNPHLDMLITSRWTHPWHGPPIGEEMSRQMGAPPCWPPAGWNPG